MRRECFVDLSGDGSSDDMLGLYHSDERGLGVQILADGAAGQILHRFSGEVGPEIRQHSLQVAPGTHIAQTRYAGYLSHGCDPNCRLDMTRQELVALRDIRKGEWLTIDYAATEDELYRQFACNCGAAACRRWIIGRDDHVNAEGIAYLSRAAQTTDAA